MEIVFMPLPLTDTRCFFRPLSGELVAVLRTLSPAAWGRPTSAGRWRVSDIVAHLVDTALRRLSFHRDGTAPPTPPDPIETERDLVAYINGLNAAWIRAAGHLSPRVLTDLYSRASDDLADFMEGLRLDGPALFPVSWAGERDSPAWLDIGREFTEVWHHAAQICETVGAASFSDRRWLHAVLVLALHALPHAYRDVPGTHQPSLVIDVTGDAGGQWTLQCRAGRWEIDEGASSSPSARATMSDEVAWRLFFNALSASAAGTLVRFEGDVALGIPLLRARSVIV
jgi:uncharacterized protein (TIGR03083 family)